MLLRKKLNDKKLLYRSWKSIYWSKSVSKKNRSKGIDCETIKDFYQNEESNLDSIFLSLSDSSYKFSKLFGFSVKKENGREYRLITAPTVRDRIVHKAILCVLHNKLHGYINTEVSYCGVKRDIFSHEKNENSLNTKTAILKLIEHLKNKNYWVFKTDIKGFYDNVPKRRLFNKFKNLSKTILKDQSLDPMVKDVIFFKLGNKDEVIRDNKAPIPGKYIGISQGSSLSQFFANIYLADFDNYMKKRYGDRIFRYIDDILIICKSKAEAEEAKKLTIKFLRKKSLGLSNDKTFITNIQLKSFNFLGLNFSTESIKWKKSKTETGRWVLAVLDSNNQRYYRNCKTLPEKIKIMNDKIQGLGDYLKYYHTKKNFELINKQIKHKIRQDKKYKKVKLLDISTIKYIIPIRKWQSLFH